MSSAIPARINPTHPVFHRHPALAGECDNVRAWLGEAWPPRVFAPKAAIARSDQPLQGFVATGWVGHLVDAGTGDPQIIDILLPGDALNFSGVAACGGSRLVALTGVQVLAIPGTLADDATRSAIDAAMVTARQSEANRHVGSLLRLGAYLPEQRLCCLFLELYARMAEVGLAGRGRMPMPLNQTILANIAGVSPVHLNRTLRTLRVGELVTINGGQALLDQAAIHARFPHLATTRQLV